MARDRRSFVQSAPVAALAAGGLSLADASGTRAAGGSGRPGEIRIGTADAARLPGPGWSPGVRPSA